MTIEEYLKSMIISRYGNVKAFATHAGIKYSSLAAILKRGIMNANIENVFALCSALNISVDALAIGKIVSLPQKDVPEDQRIINLEEFLGKLFENETMPPVLDGVPLSEDEMNSLLEQCELLIDVLRIRRLKEGNIKQ
jgi:hypothetical protein